MLSCRVSVAEGNVYDEDSGISDTSDIPLWHFSYCSVVSEDGGEVYTLTEEPININDSTEESCVVAEVALHDRDTFVLTTIMYCTSSSLYCAKSELCYPLTDTPPPSILIICCVAGESAQY